MKVVGRLGLASIIRIDEIPLGTISNDRAFAIVNKRGDAAEIGSKILTTLQLKHNSSVELLVPQQYQKTLLSSFEPENAISSSLGDSSISLKQLESALNRRRGVSVGSLTSFRVSSECDNEIFNNIKLRKLTVKEEELLKIASSGDFDALRSVEAANSDFLCHDRLNGMSLLHKWVLSNSIKMRDGIKYLLSRGIHVNVTSSNGATPLHFAAGVGNLDAVDELLHFGADPLVKTKTWGRNIFGRDSGQNPLFWASASNHANVVRLLGEASFFASMEKDEHGCNPADIAKREHANEARVEIEKIHSTELRLFRFRLESVRVHSLPFSTNETDNSETEKLK
jgi:Ankyrin repeats (3 copies)